MSSGRNIATATARVEVRRREPVTWMRTLPRVSRQRRNVGRHQRQIHRPCRHSCSVVRPHRSPMSRAVDLSTRQCVPPLLSCLCHVTPIHRGRRLSYRPTHRHLSCQDCTKVAAAVLVRRPRRLIFLCRTVKRKRSVSSINARVPPFDGYRRSPVGTSSRYRIYKVARRSLPSLNSCAAPMYNRVLTRRLRGVNVSMWPAILMLVAATVLAKTVNSYPMIFSVAIHHRLSRTCSNCVIVRIATGGVDR